MNRTLVGPSYGWIGARHALCDGCVTLCDEMQARRYEVRDELRSRRCRGNGFTTKITNAVKPEGRLIVIMFDWSIRFDDRALAKRIAVAAVDQLGPNDLAAVVFTSAFANAGHPQNFTADRARLLAVIDQSFAVALHDPPYGPGHGPRNGNGVMIDDPEGYESGDCHCRVCVPETIGRVADAVRDVQGRRKIVLFIGTYFRLYIDPVGVETESNSPLGGSAISIRELSGSEALH
jgi:hypothetical protein